MDRPDRHTVVRYVIAQLPGILILLAAAFVIGEFTDWPLWPVWGIFCFWILKDVVLFFWLWPSYRSKDGEEEPLVGARGTVTEACKPEGIVEVDGVRWRAVAVDEGFIAVGSRIEVRERRGLTLYVQPFPGND